MTLRPNSGSHLISAGQPGVLYIGDVGWTTWEDLNVASRAGMNFGRPAFEGITRHNGYMNDATYNYDAPNSLNGQNGWAQPYFYFQDLIQQDTLNLNPSFPNPCDPNIELPGTIEKFVHSRPLIDWRHGAGPSRAAIYDGSDAAVIDIGAPGSPVSGPQFGGNSSTGGTWYREYQ